MRVHILTLALIATPAAALAASADGVWKTQASDSGGYLEVTVAPCTADASKTCGVVSKAFKAAGAEDAAYQYLGKPILEGMASDGDGRYSGGTIFDPENGKTYNSKMSVKGNELDVDGCISFICEGEVWSRVK